MCRIFFEGGEELSAEMSSAYSACLEQFSQCSLKVSDIDKLVLDFLAEEGHYEPWLDLAEESGLNESSPPLPYLQERSRIRELIIQGQIAEAASKINDLNPMILEHSPAAHFLLMQQKLLEEEGLEREELLEKIEKELSPIVLKSPELLPNLEEAVLRCIFKSRDNLVERRKEVARSTNRSILSSFRIAPKQELLLALKESHTLLETLPANSPLKRLIPLKIYGCKFLSEVAGGFVANPQPRE
jgi:hypothetical protein